METKGKKDVVNYIIETPDSNPISEGAPIGTKLLVKALWKRQELSM